MVSLESSASYLAAAPIVQRVASRFLCAQDDVKQGAAVKKTPQDAAYDFLHKSKIGDLVMGMAAEARKDGQKFGMRDAKEAIQHWVNGGHEDKKPAQIAARRYLTSDHGKRLLSTLTHGVAEALKGAGMKPVGFRDVGNAIIAYLGA